MLVTFLEHHRSISNKMVLPPVLSSRFRLVPCHDRTIANPYTVRTECDVLPIAKAVQLFRLPNVAICHAHHPSLVHHRQVDADLRRPFD